MSDDVHKDAMDLAGKVARKVEELLELIDGKHHATNRWGMVSWKDVTQLDTDEGTEEGTMVIRMRYRKLEFELIDQELL